MTDPNGVVTHYGYDAQNRLTKVIENYQVAVAPTATVNVETRYTYDALGNRLTIRSARAVLENQDWLTRFGYDRLGRLTSERDPLGYGTDYGYDILGQRVKQQPFHGLDGAGNPVYAEPTAYRYNALGQLEAIDYPGTNLDVTFTYLPTGQRQVMTDGLGITTWQYDGLGRVLSVTDPFQQVVGYGYDGQRQRSLTYPDQKSVQYDYDGLGRLQTVTDWNAQQTSYTYSGRGSLQNVQRPNGVTSTYTYTGVGALAELVHQLAGESEPLSRFAYTYDPAGNRLSAEEHLHQQAPAITAPPAAPQSLTAAQRGYQAIGLTWNDTASDESGYRIERSTDGVNWQMHAELGADSSRYVDRGLLRHTDYWYRLSAWNELGDAIPLELRTSTAFEAVDETGLGGTVTTNVSGTVDTQIAYVYDELYRLTEANYDNGVYHHYAYDSNGNRLSETTSLGTVESLYDPSNRLTSVAGVAYQWDPNGNLLSDGTSTYAYDAANRLTSVVQDGQTTTFEYNGLGDRLKENGTQFVLDLNAGLTQVLSDGTNTYLYGNGRIAQESTGRGYFLGDALGSVRQVADRGGTVVLTRSYQPYGEELSSIGDGSSPYGFTGEWNDNSSLVYLRARFYSSLTGRFLNRDRWQGDFDIPITLNKWLYGYGNPVIFTDHTGLMVDNTGYQGGQNNRISACSTLTGNARKNCEDSLSCKRQRVSMGDSYSYIAEQYGVVFSGDGWENLVKSAALTAIADVGSSFSKVLGGTGVDAFRRVYRISERPLYLHKGNSGPFWYDGDDIGSGMLTVGKTVRDEAGVRDKIWLIKYVTTYSKNFNWAKYNFVHELGHLFNAVSDSVPYTEMSSALSNESLYDPNQRELKLRRPNLTSFYGFHTAGKPWQMAISDVDRYWEIFADMFLGWTYNQWENVGTKHGMTRQAKVRARWMDSGMKRWFYDQSICR